MKVQILILSVLLSVSLFTPSLADDCYIDSEDLILLQFPDHQASFDYLSQVTYLNNDVVQYLDGPVFTPSVSSDEPQNTIMFYFNLQNWLLQGEKTEVFSYNNLQDDISISLQFTMDSLIFLIQDGENENENSNPFNLMPYTWYQIIITNVQGELTLYVNSEVILENDGEHELIINETQQDVQHSTYQFGSEDNFDGYFNDMKIITNTELEEYQYYCLYQNQCSNQGLWSRNYQQYDWYNNQCKAKLCLSQNELFQQNTRLFFTVNRNYYFDQQYLKLVFQPSTSLKENCVTLELKMQNYNTKEYTRQAINGNINNFEQDQSLQTIEQLCDKQNTRDGLQFICYYQIVLSFADASTYTTNIPVAFTYPKMSPQVKLTVPEQKRPFNQYDTVINNSQLIAQFNHYNEGNLYLMTSKRFNHKLPDDFQFPNNYHGSFYIQWQINKNQLLKEMYLDSAAIYQKTYNNNKYKKVYDLDVQYSQNTSTDSLQNMIATCKQQMTLEQDMYIQLVFDYKLESNQNSFFKLQSKKTQNKYIMSLPLQILRDMLLQ